VDSGLERPLHHALMVAFGHEAAKNSVESRQFFEMKMQG